MRTRSKMCSRGGGDTLSPIRINLAGLDLETSCKRGEAPCSSFTAPPLVSFTQPPPTYNRPRPPLFPVPPPGNCLLPPPPLPAKVKENPNISNSHWAEAPPLIKANSWPSTAAAGAGDFTSSCIYQRRALAKTSSRTKLDPTSRPFTPGASLSSTASSMLLEEMADDEVAAEDVLWIGKREAEKEEGESPLPKDPAFLLPRRLDISSDSGTDTSPPR